MYKSVHTILECSFNQEISVMLDTGKQLSGRLSKINGINDGNTFQITSGGYTWIIDRYHISAVQISNHFLDSLENNDDKTTE